LQQVARVSVSLISPPFFINHYILNGHELRCKYRINLNKGGCWNEKIEK